MAKRSDCAVNVKDRGDRAKLPSFRSFHHFAWDGRLRSKTIGHYIRECKKDREQRISLNIARLKLRCSDYPSKSCP